VQAGVAMALISSGGFEDLLQMTSLTMVLTGALTVSCVFVLRRRRPDVPRPYRATGYPWLPGVYVASCALVIGVMLSRAAAGEPGARYPLLGLAVFAAAFAGHHLARRRR
jgi:APA family basic amino acid/polyamine antiporter